MKMTDGSDEMHPFSPQNGNEGSADEGVGTATLDEEFEDRPVGDQPIPGTTGESSQTLENTIDGSGDSISESQLEEQAEDNVAEQMLNEYMRKYLGSTTTQERIAEAGTDLKKQWQVADELSLLVLHKADFTQMSQPEIEKHKRSMQRRIKVYNTLKYIGINGFNIEKGSFLRRLKKQRDRLQQRNDVFTRELKGLSSRNENGELYSRILGNMPEYITSDPRYSSVMGFLQTHARDTTVSGGLRAQYRELGKQARFLSDIDDILEATVVKYDGKLEQKAVEIKDLEGQLADHPGDKRLMRRRSKAVAMYNTYEGERDRYVDMREEVFDQLTQIKTDYELVEQQVNLREVAIMRTKKALGRMNSVIKHVENHIQNKSQMMFIGGHLMEVQDAYGDMDVAEMMSTQGDAIAHSQYRALMEQDDHRTDNPATKSNGEWRNIAESMRVRKREEMESFKQKVRHDLYQPV
jgi:hypothetical protein